MKTLFAPTRAAKAGIDQTAEAIAGSIPHGYIPIETHQRWTGSAVDAATALNYITILQCVTILSETFASLPVFVYRRRSDGGRDRAEDHPLYRTLHDQANPDLTAYAWRLLLRQHIATWGNHFSEVVREGNGEISLYPIRPDRMRTEWRGGGGRKYTYCSPSGKETEMRPGSVFHVAGLGDGLVGYSPITLMRRAISLARTAERFGQSFFDNGARPATVMKHPGTLSQGAVERLGAQMDALRGAGNAGRTVILEEGLDFDEVGIPPEDAQYMETRLFQKRELAAAYRIPGGMVGDPERGEEKEDEEARKFIKGAIVPGCVNFEQEVSRQLIAEDDVYAEVLVDGYLRGDPKARADAYAVMWEHSALNADGWRRLENLDPLPDGLGETFWRPANWVPVEDVEEEPEPVGGDASEPTQFGADGVSPEGPEETGADAAFGQTAGLVPGTTRAKSALRRFACPTCGKLINRLAAPGTIGYCKACRAERELVE